MSDAEPSLEERLRGEVGQIQWPELERHFARGVLLEVASEEDIVAVAAGMARDDSAWIGELTGRGALSRPEMSDAASWHADGASFQAVVVAPWVLVQRLD